MTEEWKIDLAAFYALGTLESEDARHAANLAANDEEFAAEARSFQDVVTGLGLLCPSPQPRPAIRKRLMDITRAVPKGLEALVPTGALPWRPSPFPGVSAKRLFEDPSGNVSWLVKLDPGATYPRHKHTTFEHCLVLEGEVRFDEYILKAGDYEVAGPNTDHSSFFSPQGAILFIIANKHDEIFH